jgi:hypothetical protein
MTMSLPHVLATIPPLILTETTSSHPATLAIKHLNINLSLALIGIYVVVASPTR